MTGERQLNHSESEGVCVNCLSSFNKLQTRFPKEPGVGGLFVVQGEIRYKIGAVTRMGVRFRGVSVTDVAMPVRAVCKPHSPDLKKRRSSD